MAKGKKDGSSVKKVGGKKGEVAAEDTGNKRVTWDGKMPADGHVVAVPEGYDFGKNLTLRKDDFANGHTFMKHRAASFRFRAEAFTKEADTLDAKAERDEKLGDDKTRSKVKRAERIAAQLGDLQKELQAAGIDINAILAANEAEKEEKEDN